MNAWPELDNAFDKEDTQRALWGDAHRAYYRIRPRVTAHLLAFDSSIVDYPLITRHAVDCPDHGGQL